MKTKDDWLYLVEISLQHKDNQLDAIEKKAQYLDKDIKRLN